MPTQIIASRWAINKAILTWEVSWDERNGFNYYNKKLRKPTVPDPANTNSGVSVGIGFDCGQFTASQIRSTWSGLLPAHMVEALAATAGAKKQAAVKLLPSVSFVDVPIEAALQEFYNIALFRTASMALKAYPDLPKLHPVEVSVILSLVYNRGALLTDDPKDVKQRRREMRQLVSAIKVDNDKTMSDLIRAMCRLWPNTLGLRRRRQAEADLIDLPDTPIAESDKLILVV